MFQIAIWSGELHNLMMNSDLLRRIQNLAKGEPVPAKPDMWQSLDELGLEVREMDGNLFLLQPLELLSQSGISRRLKIQTDLEIFPTLDSTNRYLMSKEPGEQQSLVCLAEQQIAGRGRRGRQWISPFGRNIYMSIGRLFGLTMARLSGLSLVVGLAVSATLKQQGLTDFGLKWPNDIIMGDGKLAGILVEVSTSGPAGVYGVMGLGLNISIGRNEAKAIDQPWAALEQQIKPSRNQLCADLLNNIYPALDKFEAEGFSVFQDAWREFNIYAGKEVEIHMGDEVIYGIDKGVDDRGNLLLQTGSGIRVFSAGEVSLRVRGRS